MTMVDVIVVVGHLIAYVGRCIRVQYVCRRRIFCSGSDALKRDLDLGGKFIQ